MQPLALPAAGDQSTGDNRGDENDNHPPPRVRRADRHEALRVEGAQHEERQGENTADQVARRPRPARGRRLYFASVVAVPHR